MKKQVLFLIPDQSVTEAERRHYAEQHPDVRFATIDPLYPLEELRAELGDGINIAAGRGKTVAKIRAHFPDLHAVEIPITAYDVIRSISTADCRGRTIAVITNSATVIGLPMFAEIYGIRILSYLNTPSTALEAAIQSARGEGAEIIIGGAVTCRTAQKMGLKAHMLLLGPESMQRAFESIERTKNIIQKEAVRRYFMESVMHHVQEGVIAVDEHGNIAAVNATAEALLECDKSAAIGQPATRFLPLNAYDIQETAEGSLVDINGHHVLVSKTPITYREKYQGAIFSLNEGKSITAKENFIRQEAYAKRHRARYHFEDVLGESRAIREAITLARQFAKRDFSILLSGASGTGKEVFAQSIHNASSRKAQPFVAVNCAAIPAELLQGELFGHAEGAYTGATKAGRPGFIEIAHGGTLFLDEIGELEPTQQVTLLRFIQERYITRVGSRTPIPINVRIIAATNTDLPEAVASGAFRADLFYRLNALSIVLPPLKDREADAILMMLTFLNRYASPDGQPFSLDEDARRYLLDYAWPGNIRELGNLCERLVASSTGCRISLDQLRQAILPGYSRPARAPAAPAPYDRKRQIHAETVEALRANRGDVGKTARQLGVARSTIWRRLKHGA